MKHPLDGIRLRNTILPWPVHEPEKERFECRAAHHAQREDVNLRMKLTEYQHLSQGPWQTSYA